MGKTTLSRWATGLTLLAIHLGALLAFWKGFFHWSAIAVAAAIACTTLCFGIALCYHRVLTHRSIRLRKPFEYVSAIFGTLAFQGDPISWVATHRLHHKYSDRPGDPHGMNNGFLWAHMTWLFQPNPAIPHGDHEQRFAQDLWASRFYRALKYLHVPLQIALAVMLFFVGGWSWVVWGVCVRLVFTYHATWLVNSAGHMFGYQTYRSNDRSTNCWWVALLSFGEGWHNNHHAFPSSARMGLRWFEIDVTWWLVQLLALLRVADDIKVPTAEMRQRLAKAA